MSVRESGLDGNAAWFQAPALELEPLHLGPCERARRVGSTAVVGRVWIRFQP